MSRTATVLTLAILLAGCVQAAEETPLETGIVVDEARPAPVFGEIVTGPAVGPDLDATTNAVPRLVAGEWWKIRYDSGFIGANTEFVRVVANVTNEGYIFGMPHEGWYKEAIAYHAPAFGDVAKNLSYQTHNIWFEPLRFPLKEGDTWRTAFAATPMVARVEKVDEFTAEISFTVPEEDQPQPSQLQYTLGLAQNTPTIRAFYDARMHEIVRMESFIGVWEVVEHGYDFEGWVTVPRGEHTAIDYGVDTPPVPTQTNRFIDVQGGYNRLTMMHLVVALSPGQFRLRSLPPEGEPFVTESSGAEQITIKFYESMKPDGVWEQEDFVGGGGATYSMGIAYHQYDIRLPDGLRRADHSHAVIR